MGRASQLALPDHATIAIVGGGPAGSFTALHLLQLARRQQREIDITIFERRCDSTQTYSGCPQCAGGISPRLYDALQKLCIDLPGEVIQQSINAITLQGRWKHLHVPVPAERNMLSVFRGTLPHNSEDSHAAFDALLLEIALQRGATLINHRVTRAKYDGSGKPVLSYRDGERNREFCADFVAITGGVNENPAQRPNKTSGIDLFRGLQPAYRPPPLRKALICELQVPPATMEAIAGELHYIESSEGGLHLDMCSILPKQNFCTITLIGDSVDRASSHGDNLEVIRDFLSIPRIRRTLPPDLSLAIRCACNPRIVVGNARHPTTTRAAVAGDMATCRQYKDGILSAHDMAARLADTIVNIGIDQRSLQLGYESLLKEFRRDNYYASVIFFLYRWFFTNRFLSRVIYQTYSSERKTEFKGKRQFGRIFWAISSCDESYRQIAWWMLKPATLWQIFTQGFLVTLKCGIAERLFHLDWKGIGRFPVAVNRETLESLYLKLLGDREHSMRYLYRIEIRAAPSSIMAELGKFGEPERGFLNPRWVQIRRQAGEPLKPGCKIGYRVLGGLIRFNIMQQPSPSYRQVRYEVVGGFADGGSFIFDVAPSTPNRSLVSVFLAFDYPRGDSTPMNLFWRSFQFLFPEFVHETLWNHALCELKQTCESIDLDSQAEIPVRLLT